MSVSSSPHLYFTTTTQKPANAGEAALRLRGKTSNNQDDTAQIGEEPLGDKKMIPTNQNMLYHSD